MENNLPKIDKEKANLIFENFRKKLKQAKVNNVKLEKAQPKKVESFVMPEVTEETKAKVKEMFKNMKPTPKQPVKQLSPEEMEQAKAKMRDAMEKFKERFNKETK